MLNLLLHGPRIVTPGGVRAGAVAIANGRIVGVLEEAEARRTETAHRLEVAVDAVISPGVVDPHVHINEPGRTEWEGFETATRAAAAGGVTTLVDMPLNSSPVTTTLSAFAAKREAARGKCRVDVGFHAGVVPGNQDQLATLAEAGVLGFKAFLCPSGIDEFGRATREVLTLAMPIIAHTGRTLLAHAEIEGPDGGFGEGANPLAYASYLASRPPTYELRGIRMLLELCEEHACPIHIVHLATGEALHMLREARNRGLPVSVETGQHYLTFVAEQIQDGATAFKCAPPIRDAANRDRLWAGIFEETIDFVATDHSPAPPARKHLEDGRFDLAWGGIASLQLALPALWTEASRRGASLVHLARWLSVNPARLVGLDRRKGSVAPGFDADLVVWAPDRAFVVDPDALHHRHKVTPYAGRELRGVTLQTYLRGALIHDQGTFPGPPQGELLV
ncbi:MAG: allantoinase AllB [Planctomycetota bacterium]|jgi:allantoinase